jgi:hypothetical protein
MPIGAGRGRPTKTNAMVSSSVSQPFLNTD